jgi:hypothetical protein
MKLRKGLVIAGASVAVLGLSAYGLYRYAPTYVRNKIAERAPYVHVRGAIEVHRHEVVLHDVLVEKANLHGTFPLVTVSINDESVKIEGGKFDYVLGEGQGSSSEGAEKHRIEASGLSGTVHKGDYSVAIDGLRVNDSEACFESFQAYHDDNGVFAWGERPGCVSRDKRHAHLGIVRIMLSSIPGMGSKVASLIPDDMEPDNVFFEDVDYTDDREASNSRVVTVKEISSGQTTLDQVRLNYWAMEGKPSRVDVNANSLSFLANRVFDQPLTIEGIRTSFNPEHVREQTLTVQVGSTSLVLDPKTYGVSGDNECNDWLKTLPKELKAKAFDGLRFTGRLGFDVHFKPEVKVSMTNTCKAVCPVKSIEALKKPFEHTIYVDYGEGDDVAVAVAGPGTQGWTPLKDISPVMPMAVINMEDKAFPTHHGFVPAALENSLKADVEKGRFIRGGSTISMQLAKNVFLTRSKTIGRKVQEAFLTMALESCLSKDQIMELYLNVVQYGPNLYGIGNATQTYFHKKPSELTAQEAFYLAMLLPHPSKAPPPNDATMKRVASLMRTLVNRGSLDPDVLTMTQDSDVAP